MACAPQGRSRWASGSGSRPGWTQNVPVALRVAGDDDLREEVEQASLLLRAEDEGLVEVQDLIAAARADYNRIVGRLYSEGFYGPVVSILIDGREAAEIAPFDAPERIRAIEIRVEPGPQYRFGRTEVAPVAPGTELPEEFARGEEARTGVVREAAASAVSGWRDVGRAKAEVSDQSIVADYARQALDVSIAIRPGPVVRFGRLDIDGNERVRTERIREIAGFPTDDVFDPDKLELVQTRLRRTGAFRAVALTEGEAVNPDGTLDIDLTVVEELPRRFGFGAEIGTTEGLSLEAFWLHRNLLGGAERLRFEGEVDGIGASGEEDPDYRLTARFERPATFDPDTDLTVLAEVERLDEPCLPLRHRAPRGRRDPIRHGGSDAARGRAAPASRTSRTTSARASSATSRCRCRRRRTSATTASAPPADTSPTFRPPPSWASAAPRPARGSSATGGSTTASGRRTASCSPAVSRRARSWAPRSRAPRPTTCSSRAAAARCGAIPTSRSR